MNPDTSTPPPPPPPPPPRQRLFFALWPAADEAVRLIEAAAAWAGGDGRAPAPADLHITLCFLGSVESSLVPALRAGAALLKGQAFQLEFSALEYWPESRVIVASAATPPSAVFELAAALHAQACALGLRPDVQRFRPHLTLRRGVRARPTLATPRPLTTRLRVDAHCFHLAQSQELPRTAASDVQAARYLKLDSWALRTVPG